MKRKHNYSLSGPCEIQGNDYDKDMSEKKVTKILQNSQTENSYYTTKLKLRYLFTTNSPECSIFTTTETRKSDNYNENHRLTNSSCNCNFSS